MYALVTKTGRIFALFNYKYDAEIIVLKIMILKAKQS
jgi:hypothetical protein